MSGVSESAGGVTAEPTEPPRSRSLLGLGAAFVGLLVLAVVHYGPRVLAPDPNVVRLAPTLLEPAESARGEHALGGGITASVFLSGLRVETPDGTVLKTTEQAAPVAVLGPAEQRSLEVNAVRLASGAVEYRGEALMSDGRRVPVAFTVAAAGQGRFTLSVSANADVQGFAVALDPRYTDLRPPTRDAETTRAWWVDGQPALVNPRISRAWRLEVSGGRVAVDRRTDGATFVQVWGAAPALTFTAPTVGS